MRTCKLPRVLLRHIGPTTEIFGNSGLPIALVSWLHQSNVHIKRKLRVWRAQKCNFLVGATTVPTGGACKLPLVILHRIGPTMEIFGNSGLPVALVPSLHQSDVYIKRKLRVWRVQKWISLVGSKTALTCAGLQTTPCHVRQYRTENENLRKSWYTLTMVPCLHQSNVHIKRNLRVWSPKMHFFRRCKNCTYLCGTAIDPDSCKAV